MNNSSKNSVTRKTMDSKHIYNLGFQALPPLKNLQSTNPQHGVPTSVHAFSVLAIAVLSILATCFLLVTYYIFVNKCCSNWHGSFLLRWFSAGQSQQEEESFIALSPTMWNRGLDESVIRDIPIFQYRKRESEEQRNVFGCIVCFNDFQDQDMLRLLPNCSHAFHLDCIEIWLQNNVNCPLCRTSVSGTVRYPLNCIVAPSSSPQGSQAFTESFMGSDEDFVVIELGNGNETIEQRQQQERNDRREVPIELRRQPTRKLREKFGKMYQRKQHHVSNSIMGDEYIDIRDRDDSFSIQPLRRSFSLDSANDQQLFLTVREIIQQDDDKDVEFGFNRFTKSLFQCGIGQRSRNAILPLECAV